MRRLCALLLLGMPLLAHNGPPFPIIQNRKLGPCVVSVWTNPDVGTGTFFIFVDPPPGGAAPKDLKFEIGVRPASHRLPEARYATTLDDRHGHMEYDAAIPFDKEELWTIRVVEHGANGTAEAVADVPVTPPGMGRWDLLWFAMPFLGIGFLWFRLAMRRRGAAAKKPAPQE